MLENLLPIVLQYHDAVSTNTKMDPKILGVIVAVAVGAVSAGLGVYWYTSQQQIQTQQQEIQAQYDISHTEQCNTKLESIKQRYQDAIARGQFDSFEEFTAAIKPEVDALKSTCGDVDFGAGPLTGQ